jgi:hypothetical protein
VSGGVRRARGRNQGVQASSALAFLPGSHAPFIFSVFLPPSLPPCSSTLPNRLHPASSFQSKLSAFENEVRNDFLGTTAAIKDVIREAESELAQVR